MSVGVQIEASGSTSHTLLERVQLHDPEAWRRFVHLYGATIFQWARKASLQASDASDIVQEVFQSVMLNIGRFQRTRPTDSFRGWLRTITINKIRDLFRNRPNYAVGSSEVDALLERLPADDDATAQLGQATLELAHRALELIQTEFEPNSWRAFLRTAVDGRTVADTADELGMSIAAVYKAKSRVVNRLRRELDGLIY